MSDIFTMISIVLESFSPGDAPLPVAEPERVDSEPYAISIERRFTRYNGKPPAYIRVASAKSGYPLDQARSVGISVEQMWRIFRDPRPPALYPSAEKLMVPRPEEQLIIAGLDPNPGCDQWF